MASKIRRGVRGSKGESVQKESCCSESNVWTRWRCKRCYHEIPAGSHGKYRQAIAARTGEWSTGSSTSSGEEERKSKSLEAENRVRPGLSPWRRKGKEPKQGLSYKRAWRKSGDWTRTLRMRSRVAKKLDEQKKSYRRIRDIEKILCVPKEFQENLKSNLQQQLQEVEQRKHDLMPEHQRVQKKSQKIQSIQDEKRNVQKENVAAEEEIRKLREDVKQKEERIFLFSDKIERNKMADAEMAKLQIDFSFVSISIFSILTSFCHE